MLCIFIVDCYHFSLLPPCLLLAALVEEVVGEVGVPGVQLAGHQLRERPRCLALRLAHGARPGGGGQGLLRQDHGARRQGPRARRVADGAPRELAALRRRRARACGTLGHHRGGPSWELAGEPDGTVGWAICWDLAGRGRFSTSRSACAGAESRARRQLAGDRESARCEQS